VPDGGSRELDSLIAIQPGDELFLAVGYVATDHRENAALDVTLQVVPEPGGGMLMLVCTLLALKRHGGAVR
jgi:hypothetical protein